jgi:UDP-N-acetylglucosamine acyltransferase
VYPFASIGLKTQDLKFKGGAPRVEVGDRTTIREGVTIHAATADGDVTRVGSDCLIMAYAHVAHDCMLGDRVILANAVALAGHVTIENQAIVGGVVGVHQFVRIGRLAIIGGCSKVVQDVPPFMTGDGNPAQVRMINKIGLERAGVSAETQSAIKQAFRLLYREQLATSKALERIEAELGAVPEVRELLTFVRASQRGIAR